MSVPSEVVEYLDSRFPQAKKDENFKLSSGDAPAAAYLLRLLEGLPSEIVTLKGEALAEFGESIESLRFTIDAWSTGDSNRILQKLPGRGGINPLTFLRKHLANLPDSVVLPHTIELAFIPDRQLRDGLRLDIGAANRSFGAADWKGCTVVSGSVVEALLLWTLDDREAQNPGQVDTAVKTLFASGHFTKLPPTNRNFWNLSQLIEVSHHLEIIKDNTAAQCRIAKEFRNLIHPGKVVRLAESCNRGTALSALAAIEHVSKDLS
ncbi:MAG: hypothetical protein E8D47_09945 [Nitrospira sp.]|nr:MAG: hypothetical protein E8D47_09945 [Nitrospira sp.]